MDWRRADMGYAAATLAAAALVGYLVAGNFGFVRGPFHPRPAEEASPPDVAALAVGTSTSSTLAIREVVPTESRRPRSSSEPPTVVEKSAPRVKIETRSGTEVKVTEPATVTGTVQAAAGLRDVVVRFLSSGGDVTSVTADVKCKTAARNDCSWSAGVPALAGSYKVWAHASDEAWRVAKAGPIDLTVLNVGRGVPQDGPTVGSVDAVLKSLPL